MSPSIKRPLWMKLHGLFMGCLENEMVVDAICKKGLPKETQDLIEEKIDATRRRKELLQTMIREEEKNLQRYLVRISRSILKGKKK